MSRLLGALCVMWCGAVCPVPAQEAVAPESRGAAPTSALLEIRAEIMVIGHGGSRRAGSESAVLPLDKVGLLRTSTSLSRGGVDPQEEVSVELRVRARQMPDGLHLLVDSRAQGQPSGELVLRSGGGLLTGTSPLFYEAYVSQATGERVVFLLSARPWEKPLELVKLPATNPRPVAYSLRIYRLTDEGPELLDAPSLASLVGHTASYSFGFLLRAAAGEEHREELQIQLQAVELRDGWLSGILSLAGHVGGSPVSQSRGWSLPSGGEAEIELQLAGAEGRELGFRIRVDVRF